MKKPKSLNQHHKVGPVDPGVLLIYKQFIDEMYQSMNPPDSPTSAHSAFNPSRLFPRVRLAIRKWLIWITRRVF